MDLQLLIDSIVRQTTVLIAQVATAGGTRAPLSQLADQVFVELADELHSQGVTRKVSADMFGLALRTYLRRIQRLRESSTERGQSLWQALLDYFGDGELRSRTQVMERFGEDDPAQVAGILRDLGDSGLLLRLGSGDETHYRAATAQELSRLQHDAEASDELLWALIYREGPLSHVQLTARVRGSGFSAALQRLVSAGRVSSHVQGDEAFYASQRFVVPRTASAGWEAAVLDHFHAVVKTIVRRLQALKRAADGDADLSGGSTYSFEVWPGHPLRQEVLGQLAAMRDGLSELRSRVRAYNDEHARPARYDDVTVYAGQCVTAHADDLGGEHG